MSQTAEILKLSKENQKFINDVRERLRDYMSQTGKSQSSLAKSVDYTVGALNSFIHGCYKGDMMEVANRIHDYLMRETQRLTAPKAPEFAPTSFAKHALTVLNYAHKNRDMGMIHGDAGVGKTYSIEHYAAKHHNVIVITAGIDLSTPKAVVEEILSRLTKDFTYGSLSSMSRQVIQLLKGSDKLLVIDEANHLNYRAREVIRKIHDQAQIGVVYCGSHDLYAQLHGKKDIIYAQLLSRIGVRRGLDRKTISMEDISLVFEQYVKLDDSCLNLLYQCAASEGGLRLAKKIYVLASTMALGDNMPLGMAFFEKALGMAMADHVRL